MLAQAAFHTTASAHAIPYRLNFGCRLLKHIWLLHIPNEDSHPVFTKPSNHQGNAPVNCIVYAETAVFSPKRKPKQQN